MLLSQYLGSYLISGSWYSALCFSSAASLLWHCMFAGWLIHFRWTKNDKKDRALAYQSTSAQQAMRLGFHPKFPQSRGHLSLSTRKAEARLAQTGVSAPLTRATVCLNNLVVVQLKGTSPR